MSAAIVKYLETEEAFHGGFVYGRPRWQFVTLNNPLTIAENKNENRVFIWVHLIQINRNNGTGNCTWTFTPSGEVMSAFVALTGTESVDGIYPFDLLVRGNHLTITCLQASTCNYGVMWQPITINQPRK